MPIIKGIDAYYLCQFYGTREAYKKATGLEAPPYDPLKPAKNWRDTNPKPTVIGGNVVRYDAVVAYADAFSNVPLVGSDGQPFTQEISMPLLQAVTVNIPPVDVQHGVPDQPMVGVIPPPLRPFTNGERLMGGFGGQIHVEIPDAVLVPGEGSGGGFTDADRVLLKRIANAVGIAT